MSKQMGRPRLADSIDSLGRAAIITDRECRANLKALAKARNMPLVRYLRLIASGEIERGQQITLLGQRPVSPAEKANADMVVKMEALRDSYSELQLAFCWFVRQFDKEAVINPSEMRAFKAFKRVMAWSMPGEQLKLVEGHS